MGRELWLLLPTFVFEAVLFAAVLLLVVERWGWPQQRGWEPYFET